MTDPVRPAEIVVILNADTLGRGDEALGAKLTGAFLRTLVALEERPAALILYNGAVHLEALRALDDAGVDLLACVTCLEHFALTERIALGRVSNMREIVQRSLAAAKVITL
jgi:hypothetical protein